jgi:hypothetical protein
VRPCVEGEALNRHEVRFGGLVRPLWGAIDGLPAVQGWGPRLRGDLRSWSLLPPQIFENLAALEIIRRPNFFIHINQWVRWGGLLT